MTDRIALLVLRLFAALMLIIGISMLISGRTLGLSSAFPTVRAIFSYFLEFGIVFSISGGLAVYLSRPRGFLLPNERETVSDEERPRLEGWLIGLAIFLVAAPTFILIELQPLQSEWDRVITLLVMSGIFRIDPADELSGILAIPVALSLTPAAIAYAGMLAFIGASVVLFPLLLLRSPRFPRLYVVCIALLAGLAVASIRAADGAALVVNALEELMQESDVTPEGIVQTREVLGQHVGVVTSAGRTLLWVLCGYLIWLPAICMSQQARTTFAGRVSGRSSEERVFDIKTITRPPGSY